MSFTPLLDTSARSLTALASVINLLTERGVRSQADKRYGETGVYAVPGTSLSAVSLFDHEGGLTLVVQDGDREVFRLYGPSEFELELMADNSVMVYDGVQPEVNELTAAQAEQLHRAIALGV